MKINKESLSPVDIEFQENLSKEYLSLLEEVVETDNLSTLIDSDRPSSNFIDLMKWVQNHFIDHLKDKSNINKFVHNRIIIDGQFLKFCEENKISVSCLYKDAIISWRTTNNYEKFFMQGVFLIKTKNVEFLHSALYHKSNNNEDEISFFIIASENNYKNYLELRNQFDDWLKKRDRTNNQIRVVGGEDSLYDRDESWEDLFLPDSLKKDLRSTVEIFLSSKEFYLSKKIPWKRGIILHGPQGNGKTSIIRTIASCYDFKPVTIVAGSTDEEVREAFSYAEEQSPSLLFFEDLDFLLENSVNTSSFLNLMDGVSSKNGLLVIATTNHIGKFPLSITDRPSRFDRKFEIPGPSKEMALVYIQKWFERILSIKKYRSLSSFIEKNKLSYSDIKELYISSMFEVLSRNGKIPTEKDVNKVLVRIMKDKNSINNGGVDTDKYFQ